MDLAVSPDPVQTYLASVAVALVIAYGHQLIYGLVLRYLGAIDAAARPWLIFWLWQKKGYGLFSLILIWLSMAGILMLEGVQKLVSFAPIVGPIYSIGAAWNSAKHRDHLVTGAMCIFTFLAQLWAYLLLESCMVTMASKWLFAMMDERPWSTLVISALLFSSYVCFFLTPDKPIFESLVPFLPVGGPIYSGFNVYQHLSSSNSTMEDLQKRGENQQSGDKPSSDGSSMAISILAGILALVLVGGALFYGSSARLG